MTQDVRAALLKTKFFIAVVLIFGLIFSVANYLVSFGVQTLPSIFHWISYCFPKVKHQYYYHLRHLNIVSCLVCGVLLFLLQLALTAFTFQYVLTLLNLGKLIDLFTDGIR